MGERGVACIKKNLPCHIALSGSSRIFYFVEWWSQASTQRLADNFLFWHPYDMGDKLHEEAEMEKPADLAKNEGT